MANEITVNLALTANKASQGGGSISTTFTYQKDMTGNNVCTETYEVDTSEDQVDYGPAIGTPLNVMIRNLDSTNDLLLGFASGVYVLKIRAGQGVLFQPYSGTSVFVKSTADTVRFQMWAHEP
jgi:hypothetical protein